MYYPVLLACLAISHGMVLLKEANNDDRLLLQQDDGPVSNSTEFLSGQSDEGEDMTVLSDVGKVDNIYASNQTASSDNHEETNSSSLDRTENEESMIGRDTEKLEEASPVLQIQQSNVVITAEQESSLNQPQPRAYDAVATATAAAHTPDADALHTHTSNITSASSTIPAETVGASATGGTIRTEELPIATKRTIHFQASVSTTPAKTATTTTAALAATALTPASAKVAATSAVTVNSRVTFDASEITTVLYKEDVEMNATMAVAPTLHYDESSVDPVTNGTNLKPNEEEESNDFTESRVQQDGEAEAKVLLKPPTCTSAKCLRLSAFLNSSMDRTQQPCESFRKFACGHWGESFSIPAWSSSWGNLEREQHLLYEEVSHLLTKERSDWQLFEVARTAYNKCMDTGTIEHQGYKTWKEEVEDKMSGFPLGENFWRKYTFNPNEMISEIHRLFGTSPLLHAEILDDERIVTLRLGRITHLQSDSESATKQEFYKLVFMSACLLLNDEDSYYKTHKVPEVDGAISHGSAEKNLAAEEETEEEEGLLHSVIPPAKYVSRNEKDRNQTGGARAAGRTRRDLLSYIPTFDQDFANQTNCRIKDEESERLFHLLESVAEVTSHKSNSSKQMREISLSQLKVVLRPSSPILTDSQLIDLEDVLVRIFRDRLPGFSPADYTFRIEQGLIDVMSILHTKDAKSVANLLASQVLLSLLDHMPQRYQTLQREFKRKSLGVTETVERKLFCARFVSDSMPLAIAHVLYNKEADRRDVWSLGRITEAISRQLGHPDGDTLSYPRWLLSRDSLDAFYSSLNTSSIISPDSSHLHNLLTFARWKGMKMKSEEDLESEAKNVLRVAGLENLGSDILPKLLLQFPFLDHSSPRFVGLGGIGMLVARRELKQRGMIPATSKEAISLVLNAMEGNEANEDVILSGFEAFSSRQMLLLWASRVWGCGQSHRDDLPAEFFHQIASAVNDNFHCDVNKRS